MQKTLIINHNGKQHVSGRYNWGVAVAIDDARFNYAKNNPELNMDSMVVYELESIVNKWIFNGLSKMFEGTLLTDDILLNEVDGKEIIKAIETIKKWHYGVDEEIKNL
jgi:hypothetical protein